MKCHLTFLLLLAWILIRKYVFVVSLYTTSTRCGNFDANLSNVTMLDGRDLFSITIQHPVLDPYLDIIPNTTYTVLIKETEPKILVSGIFLEITEHDKEDPIITGQDTTIIDDQTAMILSENLPGKSLICNFQSEISVMWTTQVYRKCYNLSAIIKSSTSMTYSISQHICRSIGNRSYYAADISGEIESPGFPQYYPDNYNISYIIFPIEKSSIYLQFQFFNLEASYRGKCFDSVTVISENIQILCGAIIEKELENLYFHSTTEPLVVSFSSDNKIGDRGFKFVYYSMNRTDCNKTITTATDFITSIGYPDLYYPNMFCVTRIRLPPEYRIQVTIKDIDIEGKTNDHCVHDYLQVISGSGSDDIFCGNLTDFSSENLFIQSSFSEIDIIFVSNYLYESRGFLIEYSSYISCSNQTFTNANGFVHSNNYPLQYANNQDCFHTINVTLTGAILELIFEAFHTESVHNAFLTDELCNLDYVELYTDSKFERICGQWKGHKNALVFRSETGLIKMRFVTNGNLTKPGFYAKWQTTSENASSAQCVSSWIERDQYWFEIVRNPRTWEEGRLDCQQKGGFLATISNFKTQFILEKYLRKR